MGVCVSSDGRRVYVGNGRGNSVSIVDAASAALVVTVPVGERAWGVALTPDDRKLYVCDSLSNQVSVLETETNAAVATIPVGDGPWGVTIRPRTGLE